MKNFTVFLTILLLLCSLGCVSKKTFEAAQGQLNACEDEKAKLEASVLSWEQRFDRESDRWKEMESSITNALPKALSEFHSERDRILRMVPEQVQAEVNAYLEDYFATVMKGFQALKSDNDEIKLELQATRKALEVVGADTQTINTAVSQTLAEERSKREMESGKREAVSSQLAEVVALVSDFDHKYLNCKDCEERLKLNKKEKDVIVGFHAQLVSRLSAIQSFSGNSAGDGE